MHQHGVAQVVGDELGELARAVVGARVVGEPLPPVVERVGILPGHERDQVRFLGLRPGGPVPGESVVPPGDLLDDLPGLRSFLRIRREHVAEQCRQAAVHPVLVLPQPLLQFVVEGNPPIPHLAAVRAVELGWISSMGPKNHSQAIAPSP